MPTRIGRDEVRGLLDRGAQVLEVLEPSQYEAAHLPGAKTIPAWELTAERAGRELDPSRPVVVYCFDSA